MSINGFLSDRSLIDATRPFTNLETLDLPCGYLDRVTVEYFDQPMEVNDLRSERLSIQYRKEKEISTTDQDEAILTESSTDLVAQGLTHLKQYPTDLVAIAQFPGLSIELDTLNAVLQSGLDRLDVSETDTVTFVQYQQLDFLEFEKDTIPTDPFALPVSRNLTLTIDNAKLSADDTAAINAMSADEQHRLFNIIEYLELGTIYADTADEINSFLVNNTGFEGYVRNSIKVSSYRTVIYLYGGLNIHRYTPTYVEFQFRIGTYTIDVKIWIDKNAFKNEYPISTIVNVIPPMDLATLLNPAGLGTDPINSAILSKQWSDALMQPEIDDRDQSGMYLFSTRYVYQSKTYQIVFSIIYRGPQPDNLSIRTAIVDYLLNSGVGTRSLWEALIPDVFYRSAFAIIPFYDNITVLTNADVYPSIIKANGLLDKLNAVVSLIPRANDPYRELMTAAYDEYFIGVAPADTNEYSSLLTVHPTYRNFSTTDAGFAEMTAADREWSIRLNQALSVAAGEVNSIEASEVTLGGLKWINFVMNYVSYLVLKKESYTGLFV